MDSAGMGVPVQDVRVLLVAVNGWALAALAVGGVFVWSGLTGQKVTGTIQSLITGQKPAGTTLGGPASGVMGSGPVVQGPAGPGQSAFAVALLRALGDPVTQANISSVVGWQQREGANSYNNPLNTTLRTPGSVATFNSAGVQEYGSITAGLQATVDTLLGGYPSILAALKSGQGLGGQPGVGQELLTWSGGGYSSV